VIHTAIHPNEKYCVLVGLGNYENIFLFLKDCRFAKKPIFSTLLKNVSAKNVLKLQNCETKNLQKHDEQKLI